jgi:hypothetical protein
MRAFIARQNRRREIGPENTMHIHFPGYELLAFRQSAAQMRGDSVQLIAGKKRAIVAVVESINAGVLLPVGVRQKN